MRLTRVKDMARVELGAQVYDQWCEIGGQPAAGVAIFQLPVPTRSRSLARLKEAMERLKKLPRRSGLFDSLRSDTFRRRIDQRGLQDVIEAGVLVLIVILVFLRTGGLC